MTTIRVSERIEMAHRLHLSEGDCNNIHGHTWTIAVEVAGELNPSGMVMDFRDLKRGLRSVLSEFDHHLLLGDQDPLWKFDLPGSVTCPRDATTEMFAREIHQQMSLLLDTEFIIEVWETPTNMARYP